jgi:hypothetical protein
VAVVVASCTEPTTSPRPFVARGEEYALAELDAEAIGAQSTGRNLGRHHDRAAGVGAASDLLVFREVTTPTGPVVQGLIEFGVTTAAMTLPTCNALAPVWPVQMPSFDLGVTVAAGWLAGLACTSGRLVPPR